VIAAIALIVGGDLGRNAFCGLVFDALDSGTGRCAFRFRFFIANAADWLTRPPSAKAASRRAAIHSASACRQPVTSAHITLPDGARSR